MKQAIIEGDLDSFRRLLQATATAHAGTPPAAVKRQALKELRSHGQHLASWALELADAEPGAQEIAAILLAELWVAGGDETLLERLEALAKSDHWEVREWAASGAGIALAGRPVDSLPLIQRWALSPSPNLRRAAALAVMYGSKGLSAEWVPALLGALDSLLADEDPYVRKNLGPFAIGDALLPRFPAPVLAWLAERSLDDRAAVRINIALVWRAAAAVKGWAPEGRAILERLAGDPRTAVRKAAVTSLRKL